MDKTQQPRGNFTMNLNYRRNGNASAPPITGRISSPENPEIEFQFSAFRQDSEKGPYWIGPVDTNRSMRQALTTEAQRGTNFVAIRENGFKVFKENPDGTPNAAYFHLSPAQQELEDAKPSFWATWTRGAEDAKIHASAWERDASRYGPWASGNTQYPLTKEEAAALEAGQPSAELMAAAEPKATRRGKAKADDHTRA